MTRGQPASRRTGNGQDPLEGTYRSSDRHVAVVCIGCAGSGSVAHVAMRQAEELSGLFRVTLVSDGFPDRKLFHVGPERVEPLRFDYLRRFCHVPNELAFAAAARKRLAVIHARDRIDLLFFHGHVGAALVGRSFRRRNSVPFGMMIHGDPFERPAGTYHWSLSSFYKRVAPIAYRESDLVVSVSQALGDCGLARGLTSDRLMVLQNGIDPVDLGLTTPPEEISTKGDLRVLFVGRLGTEKGVEFLLRACAGLAGRGEAFELRLVGDGPLAGSLRRLSDELGIGEQVEFITQIPRSSLGDHYSWAQVACVPSLSDPLPTVVLESLVAGRPVIATRVGGIPTMVEHGVTGLLVEPGSAEAISASLMQLSADRSRLAEMGKDAYASVYPTYSWREIGSRLASRVNSTVDRFRRRSSGP